MANAFRFRRILPLAVLIVLLMLPTGLMANWWHGSHHFRGRKYKAPPPEAKITVLVKSEQFDKPINNASVIFHSTRDNHPDGFMELKTNRQGEATITVIPVGDTMVLQVLADGYQTFGQVYKVDGPKKSITVVLLPPQRQFSDYRNKPTGEVGVGAKGTTEPQSQQKQKKDSSKQKK